MPALTYDTARTEDWPSVRALLEACGLPLAGIDEALVGFIMAHTEAGELLGCAALERYGRSGLLRSVAVAPVWRGQGVAGALVAALLDQARAQGLTDITLLTTAADYFPRFGFAPVSRAEAPEAVRASIEFCDACPETATVMTLALDEMCGLIAPLAGAHGGRWPRARGHR